MRKASTNQRRPMNGAAAPITIALRLLTPQCTLRLPMRYKVTDRMEAMTIPTTPRIMIVMKIAKPAILSKIYHCQASEGWWNGLAPVNCAGGVDNSPYRKLRRREVQKRGMGWFVSRRMSRAKKLVGTG